MKSETSSHTEETSLVVGVKLLYTGHQAVEIEVPGSLGKKPIPNPGAHSALCGRSQCAPDHSATE